MLTSPILNRIAEGLFLLALVVWVGGAIMFTFVVAPTVFQVLPTEQAGRVVGAVFPTYYALGGASGALMLLVGLLLYRGARSSVFPRALALIALMLVCNTYAGLVVQPRATELKIQMRDRETVDQRAEFRRLHGLAMGLNAIVLLGGVGLVAVWSRRLGDTK